MIFLYIFFYLMVGGIIARVLYDLLDEDEEFMPLFIFGGLLWPIVVIGGVVFYASKKPAAWLISLIRK